MNQEQVRLWIAGGFVLFFVLVWLAFCAVALSKGDRWRALSIFFGAPALFLGLFMIGFTGAECAVGGGQCFLEWWVVAIPLVWVGTKLLRRHGSLPAA
jgi:hypothetical protein